MRQAKVNAVDEHFCRAQPTSVAHINSSTGGGGIRQNREARSESALELLLSVASVRDLSPPNRRCYTRHQECRARKGLKPAAIIHRACQSRPVALAGAWSGHEDFVARLPVETREADIRRATQPHHRSVTREATPFANPGGPVMQNDCDIVPQEGERKRLAIWSGGARLLLSHQRRFLGVVLGLNCLNPMIG
jgi:hypothetical protein